MLECEYCKGSFNESQIGLAEKLFHEIVHHTDAINK